MQAWELLASGKTVVTKTPDAEGIQTLVSRGLAVDVLSAGEDLVPHLIGLARERGEVVYAADGSVLEAEETLAILNAAKDAGIDCSVAPAVSETHPSVDLETSAFAAAAASRGAESFRDLVSIMARLRAPGGCPWDAEQTHESLSIHMLEEAHEAVDAIDRKDMRALEDELGDVLLQVVFHSEIAAESGHFEVADVIDGLVSKLVHRHPHVFGDVEVYGAGEVVANWEMLKQRKDPEAGLDEGIPKSLPALLLAHKVQRRLSGAGREFSGSADRVREMAARLGAASDDADFGRLLFEISALASAAGIDPEGALRRTAHAFLKEGSS